MNPGPVHAQFCNRVLNSNDCARLMASFVASLMTVADPEQVRKALVGTLNDWDEKVRLTHEIHREAIRVVEQRVAAAKAKGPARQ